MVWSVRYTHTKVTRTKGYFTHDKNGGGDNLHTTDHICEMMELLVDHIFVRVRECFFGQVIGNRMRTNCAPLLGNIFFHSYENEFLDNMIKKWPEETCQVI